MPRLRASQQTAEIARRHQRRRLRQRAASQALATTEKGFESPALVAQPLETAVNLLDPANTLTIPSDELERALDFAFAGGGCKEDIIAAVRQAVPTRSTWDEECFASDLFVDDLVRVCFGAGAPDDGIDAVCLVRMLSRPPTSGATIRYRQGILRELSEDGEVQGKLRKLYGRLAGLRGRFDHPGALNHRESTERRLEILEAFRDVVTTMREDFALCESGLRGISLAADRMMSDEAFTRLAELLDYRSNMATVDLRLRVGVDGRIHGFEVLSLTEHDGSQFYQPPTKRILERISLWWRGLSFKPEELVERWLDAIFLGIRGMLPPLFQLMSHAELYLGALAFRDRCHEAGLPTCLATISEGATRQLQGLYNPLLFAQDRTPVPADIEAQPAKPTTIVTGPNSAGKTRLLQAIGLSQLLGQSGLFVPAELAILPRVPGLFVSMSDPKDVSQREGRLGSELLRIRSLFEHAPERSLVILDELCSGTNPSEGEELFELLLSLLGELEPEVFIATHFLGFAQRLQNDPKREGIGFLCSELDRERRPTYRLVAGVADRSLADATAKRLGVTKDQLIALVRSRRD